MTANEERWLEIQIARWERARKRADTVLEHLYGLRDALSDDDETTNSKMEAQQVDELDTEAAMTSRTKLDDEVSHERSQHANEETADSVNTEATKKTNEDTTNRREVSSTKKPPARETICSLLRKYGALTIPSLDVRLEERGQKITREGISKALKKLEEQGTVVRETSAEPGSLYQFRLATKGEQSKMRHDEQS